MGWSDVWDFVTGAAKTASKHQGLIKTGIAALSTYGAFKDQQKKNEMQQAAYDDYMRQAEAAGFEAQAAVDLNLTPMTVSGVPTTKADVTDFTAVAAKGGLMSIPNKQRKRYAYGPEIEDVEVMDEEVITPYDLQMEEGVNIGEQVRAPGSASPREGAWNIWNSGAIPQEIYEFDFEIFFDSGDWMDMLKGQAPVQENMQMASDPSWESEWEDAYQNYVAKQIELGQEFVDKETFMMDYQNNMANGGIIGLRHGGRPGYNIGDVVTADAEAVVSEVPQSQVNQIEAERELQTAYQQIFAKFYERFPNIDTEDMTIADMVALLQAEGVMEIEDLGILGLDRSLDMITPQSAERSAQRMSMGDTQWGDIPDQTGKMAKGGRPGYDSGIGPVGRGMMNPAQASPEKWQIIKSTLNQIFKEAGGGAEGYRAVEEFSRENPNFLEGHQPVWQGDEIRLIEPQIQYENVNILDSMTGNEDGIIKIDMSGMFEENKAKGGRIGKDDGGIMNLGGLEKDYRTTGGFVPIGAYEKKDDVPARLSKNEFVMTADAVRAAGGGSINKGAQRMYDTMKHLEAQPTARRMTA